MSTKAMSCQQLELELTDWAAPMSILSGVAPLLSSLAPFILMWSESCVTILSVFAGYAIGIETLRSLLRLAAAFTSVDGEWQHLADVHILI